MDLQPSLRGQLVHLRPLTLSDFEGLYEAARDPLIWEQHPESTRHEPAAFRRYFEKIMSSGGALAILDVATGRIIGTSSYYNYHPANSEVSIGYTFLEKKFWGGAYNREVKSLMVNHAFQTVNRILFEVGAANVRSQKALQKIGATFLAKTNLPGLDGALLPYLVFVIEK